MRHRTFSLTCLAMLAIAVAASAQEVESTVSINVDQLPPALRDEVISFGDDLKRYVDEMRWTEYEWEGSRLPMTFNVVFTGYSSGTFSAKLLVGSQRIVNKSERHSPIMKVFDEGWTFPYTRSQPFQRNLSRYDALTGLIDFYVYIALGLDLDSYELYGGRQMYARAMEIAQRAQVNDGGGAWTTQAPSGSYSRYGFIRELSELRYNPIRRFIFDYHYNGLDLLSDKRAVALDSINSFLGGLVLAKNSLVEGSAILRVLTDAKHDELAELFIGYPDPTVWRKLSYIDPGHATVYEDAKNRR